MVRTFFYWVIVSDSFIQLPFWFFLDMLLQNFEKEIEKLHAVNEQYKFLIDATFPLGKLFNFREYIFSPALGINFVCLDSQII